MSDILRVTKPEEDTLHTDYYSNVHPESLSEMLHDTTQGVPDAEEESQRKVSLPDEGQEASQGQKEVATDSEGMAIPASSGSGPTTGEVRSLPGYAMDAVKAAPHVAGELAKDITSSLMEFPFKAGQIIPRASASIMDMLGYTDEAAKIRSVAEGQSGVAGRVNKVAEDLFKYVPEAQNEHQKAVADIIAPLIGGVKGSAEVLSTLAKDAPAIFKSAYGIIGGVGGEALTGSSQSNDMTKQPLYTGKDSIVPLIAPDADISPDMKQLLVSPLESVPLQMMFTGIVNAGKSLVKGDKAGADVVANALKNYAEIEGMGSAASETQAKMSIKNMIDAEASGKEVDPGIGWIGKTTQRMFDKNKPLFNIESQLDDIPSNAPLTRFKYTSAIQRAEQREIVAFDRALRQGIVARVGDGINEDVLIPMTIQGKKVESVADIIDTVNKEGKQYGLDFYAAAKYRQDKRIMQDYIYSESHAAHSADVGTIDQEIKNLTEAKVAWQTKTNKVATPKIKKYESDIKTLQAKKAELVKSAGPARRGIGDDIAEVEDRIATIESNAPEWAAKVDELFNRHYDGWLEYLKQHGSINDDEIARLKATYKDNYFPGYREFDGAAAQKAEGATPISRGKGIKSAEGGNKDYMDPVQAFVMHDALVAGAGARNRTLNAMMDLFDRLPSGSWNKVFSTPKEQYIKQMGLDKTAVAEELVEDNKELKELFHVEDDFDVANTNTMSYKDGEVTFNRLGKKVKLHVKDKNIMEMFESLANQDKGKLFTIAQKLRNVERAVYTLNPGFVLSNVMMDATYGALRSDTGQKPFLNVIQGAFSSARNPDMYRFYLDQMGARQGFYGATRREDVINELQQSLRSGKTDFIKNQGLGEPLGESQKKLKSLTNKFTYGLEKVGTKAENLGRFQEWYNTVKSGESSALGVNRANELTVNFHKYGSDKTLQKINKLSVFVGASLQGMNNTWRLAIEKPWLAPKLAVKYITIPTLAIYDWNVRTFGPEAYYDIPKDVRDRNYVIRYGWDKDDYIKIPKERIISPFFSNYPQAALDDLYEKTGSIQQVHALSKAMVNTFDMPSLIPVVGQPVVESLLNENRFGRPLVSDYTDSLPAKEQYSPYTTPTYRAIGEVFNASPEKWQTLGQEVTGEFGRAFTQWISDPLIRKAMDYPEITEEERTAFFQRFFPTPGQDGAMQAISNMNRYINMSEEESKFKLYTNPQSLNTTDDKLQARAVKYIEDNREDFIPFKEALDAARKQIGDRYKEMSTIQNSSTLDTKAKDKEVTRLRAQQHSIAKDFITRVVLKNDKFRKYYGYSESYNRGIQGIVNEKIIEPLGLQGTTEENK